MKKFLVKIQDFLNKTVGTKIDETYWKFRHIYKNSDWAAKYISPESIGHPHREFLIGKIMEHQPFESILEVGCASGPNLYLLAKKNPGVKFYGTDISKSAIATGQKWFEEQGIKNISFFSAKAEDFSKFSDKSIDLIFTDAILIYVGPDKIKKVLKEILRVARKAVIFNEWHADDRERFYEDHWVYNYKLLFNGIVPEGNIKITKLPENLWSGRWTKFGHIIEVNLQNI
jgi:ubiquinone/menaquinone biosynthesis C-methylase UbiE